jgi:hypothetical protein
MLAHHTDADHDFIPTRGGAEVCRCGSKREAGSVSTRREIVATVTTQVSAPCTHCGTWIMPGTPRSKVWESGMARGKRSKHGPGVWMHAGCAETWTKESA